MKTKAFEKIKNVRNKPFSALKYALLAYLLLTVIYPIVRLFFTITGEDIKGVFTAAQFWPMLQNSLITTLIATVLSVGGAFAVAYCLNRSRVRFKAVWVILFTVPMLIPSISHGMGLVLLFGDNGIFNNLFGVDINLYGYTGIIMGSILYSFPVAFLMFYDSFQYEDFTIYESASVLGVNKPRQFLKITLPSMSRTIVSAVLSVFTMVFTDYGVPLMTGGTVMTLPVYMYREVIGMLNFSGGAVVGAILILPALIAFLADLKSNSTGASSTVTKPYKIEKNTKRDVLAYVALALTLIVLCMPVIAFACLGFVKQYPIDWSFSFANVDKLLQNGLGMGLVNSLAVALLTALIGTVLSYFSAYAIVRSKKQIPNKVLHLCSLLSMAIPGVVLGLSYAMAFKGIPIYTTIFILVIVNIAHFFSSPYLMAYNSLSKFNPNLEDVAQTLGVGKMRLLTAVYMPSTVSTIIEMYSYYFVNSMITISAVSFLINFRTTPLSLMIPQLESQSFIEGTALVSLLILALNLIEKGIAFLVKAYADRKERKLLAVSEIESADKEVKDVK
ncbi:MAG: ABC transporter permease subunit [Clostridia bacterium]|nr:ABC transporter permease subunit [Clostridia bacterium]